MVGFGKRLRVKSSIWLLLLTILPLSAGDDFLKKALEAPGRTEDDLARDKTSKPAEVLAFFGVKPGMVITDLFSGEGYYTEILSHALGSKGKVYAHNNKAYLDFLKEKATARYKDDHLENVTLLHTEFEDFGLAPASQDMILMVLSYHDIYFVTQGWPKVDKDRFFKQIYDALKPGGILAVVDHAASEGSKTEAAQELHRIDEVYAKQDIEAAGFTFEAASDLLRNPDDDKSKTVFDPEIRRKTDRFVYRFRKPK